MATRIKGTRLDAAIFVGSISAASIVDLSRRPSASGCSTWTEETINTLARGIRS
jgi:hypothetical protein